MTEKCKVLKMSLEPGVMTKAIGPNLMLGEAEEFARVGATLVELCGADRAATIEAAGEADFILATGVPVERWLLDSAPRCLAVVTLAVGFDNIDVQAATENNILVVNNPSFAWCVEEVSNHALLLLLACAKKLRLLDTMIRKGHWTKAKEAQPPMGSIWGQTLGVIGCGAIGRMLARKARCLGLDLLGYDPYVDRGVAQESEIRLVSLAELLKESDYVSAHPNLTETSCRLMNREAFRQMKSTAYFINTSRGKVVDETALIEALQEKWIAGAGLDVFESEPVDENNPLTKMDNVILLPHSGSYSDEAFSTAPVNIANEVARVMSGKWPRNVVNKSVTPRVTLTQADD
jgi:D-3-phosphoglycerate dehydrogenase / 2-oxoglutarate reductase